MARDTFGGGGMGGKVALGRWKGWGEGGWQDADQLR